MASDLLARVSVASCCTQFVVAGKSSGGEILQPRTIDDVVAGHVYEGDQDYADVQSLVTAFPDLRCTCYSL
jgi:hypothetical protein